MLENTLDLKRRKTDMELSTVGKSVTKKDAMEKALGKTRFAADIEIEGMVYGAVVRSPHPAALIKRIDASKALAMKGVYCVLTAGDIPGANRIGIIIKDEPVLVDDKVRRVGDAVALVAADTLALAREAAQAVEVEYELLEPVLSFERAMEKDSPKIHGENNIYQKKTLIHGDIEKGFAESDIIIENTYETSMLSHMFIEPDAGLAHYRDGVMTLISSTQNPHYDRDEVARMLNIPYSRVRNIQAATGGGFGGKLDVSVQCHAALLAWHTNRPVKMVRTRRESTMVSSKRHPITIYAKTGAAEDGTLKALYCHITSDSGAYASYGPAVITRAMVHCSGPYEIPNVKVDAQFVYSNNPMCGAFRGFGVPQVSVCHEGQMDALGRALGIDPFELRLKNALRSGSAIATNQVLYNGVGFVETLERAREKSAEVMPDAGGKS